MRTWSALRLSERTNESGLSARIAPPRATPPPIWILPGDSARFETKTSFDRDDVARVMGQIIDLAPAGKRLEEIPDLHQSFVHIVSRNTGLTLHSVETSRAVDDDPDGASEKVITLERIG